MSIQDSKMWDRYSKFQPLNKAVFAEIQIFHYQSIFPIMLIKISRDIWRKIVENDPCNDYWSKKGFQHFFYLLKTPFLILTVIQSNSSYNHVVICSNGWFHLQIRVKPHRHNSIRHTSHSLQYQPISHLPYISTVVIGKIISLMQLHVVVSFISWRS